MRAIAGYIFEVRSGWRIADFGHLAIGQWATVKRFFGDEEQRTWRVRNSAHLRRYAEAKLCRGEVCQVNIKHRALR